MRNVAERKKYDRSKTLERLTSSDSVDIFVYEPFPFDEEYSRSVSLEIADGVSTRIVSLETLLSMKREAGRPQDLLDIAELERGQRITHEEGRS